MPSIHTAHWQKRSQHTAHDGQRINVEVSGGPQIYTAASGDGSEAWRRLMAPRGGGRVLKERGGVVVWISTLCKRLSGSKIFWRL